MDPFTIAMIVMAVGGAVYGGVSAKKGAVKQNKAVAEAARANIASIDTNIQQSRLGYLDVAEQSSRLAQVSVGAARNAIGFDSGNSVTQYIAAGIADQYADQFIRKTNQQAQEQALQTEKEVIARNARNGMVSPGTAGLQGAIQGAQQGLALGSAIQGVGESFQKAAAAEREAAMFGDQKALVGLQIQGAQESLTFQRSLNDWQSQQFGAALQLRQSLGQSPFRGWTAFDWAFGSRGYRQNNPIAPYAGGR